MRVAFSIIQIVLAIILIVIVLLQESKSAGLSGTIAGGAETFFGRNKGRTIESMLGKWTSVVAILFLACSLAIALFVK